MSFENRAKDAMSSLIGELQNNRVSYTTLFVAFNFALFFVLRLVLLIMRKTTDLHEAVSISFAHVLITIVAWAAVLFTFAAFFRAAKIQTQLKNTGAILVAAAALELLGMLYITGDTFLYVPRNLALEQSRGLRAFIGGQNKMLPMKINDEITLKHVELAGNMILFSYDFNDTTNVPKTSRYESEMRKGLKDMTCQFYNQDRDLLKNMIFEHTFFQKGERQLAFRVDAVSCSAAGKDTPGFLDDFMAPAAPDDRPPPPPGLYYRSARGIPRGTPLTVGKKESATDQQVPSVPAEPNAPMPITPAPDAQTQPAPSMAPADQKIEEPAGNKP